MISITCINKGKTTEKEVFFGKIVGEIELVLLSKFIIWNSLILLY